MTTARATHKIIATYTDSAGTARAIRIGTGLTRPDGTIGLAFDCAPPAGANATLVPLLEMA